MATDDYRNGTSQMETACTTVTLDDGTQLNITCTLEVEGTVEEAAFEEGEGMVLDLDIPLSLCRKCFTLVDEEDEVCKNCGSKLR